MAEEAAIRASERRRNDKAERQNTEVRGREREAFFASPAVGGSTETRVSRETRMVRTSELESTKLSGIQDLNWKLTLPTFLPLLLRLRPILSSSVLFLSLHSILSASPFLRSVSLKGTGTQLIPLAKDCPDH